MKILFFILLFVIFIFLLLFFYTWYRLHNSLAVHVTSGKDTPATYQLPHKTRYFHTKDGVKIVSWYIPVDNAKAVVILVNGFQKTNGGKPLMLAHADYLHDAGYTTLLIDLRSMGETKGDRVTLGVHEWKDAEAAYDYVSSLPENKGKKIGFFGNSMGAVTSIITTGMSGKGDFVIASVPFASFHRLFNFQVKKENLWSPLFLPLLRLAAIFELGNHYEYYAPVKWVKHIHVPIFLISAKHDETVNSDDAKYVFDQANKPKEYWQANASHDIFEDDPEEFQKKVLGFLEKYR